MSPLSWLDAHGAGIAASAAVWAAVASSVLLWFSRQQVREALEMRYAQQRPLIVPEEAPKLQQAADGREYLDFQGPDSAQPIQNIGLGLALNVWGVIFGPPQEGSNTLEQRRTFMSAMPIPSGAGDKPFSRIGVTELPGTASVDLKGKYTLSAPPTPTLQETLKADLPTIIARYTITYHDIFGRRHASIYDYDAQHRWRSVAFLSNIPQDLEELNRKQHIQNHTSPPPQVGPYDITANS